MLAPVRTNGRVSPEDYQNCMNGRNKGFVSIVPPQGNLATELVGLVIKYHLVEKGGKIKFTFVDGSGGKMKDRMMNT